MPQEIICEHCEVSFNSKGITAHVKSCKQKKTQLEASKKLKSRLRQQDEEAILENLLHPQPNHKVPAPASKPATINNLNRGPNAREWTQEPLIDDHLRYSPDPDPIPGREPAPQPEAANAPEPHRPPPNLGDIKRKFHPHSGLPETVVSQDEYLNSQVRPDRPPPSSHEPWKPFQTRLDFEVADFCQDVMLNSGQIDTLITLIRRCAANISSFTLHTHGDLDRQWEVAAKKCTAFERTEVQVPYKDDMQTFEMHSRPLWDWTLDLVQDPRLSDFFVWDAERAYFYNGSKWERFFTEPWTADGLWEVQSKLPNSADAKACPYIIYADKAKLSSFGTQKGYPIVARLANIFVSLRNTTEWGGGQFVGWLPVIDDKETSAEGGKQAYVNFKNAVWHAAFYRLLESVEAHSFTGCWTKCGDGVLRQLFPMILILACDYEEACVMALTRGSQAHYPCPICLVHKDDQHNLSLPFQMRNSQETQEIIQQARLLKRADNREEMLKSYGLRDVDNVFWKIAFSDPYRCLSWDKLHSYGGQWNDHLFSQLKKHAERHGGRTAAKIDKQFDLLPRWRNLNHFSSVMSTSFNDGSKHEDIAKMILFTAHNILTDNNLDLKLLRCIRSFLELLMHSSRELHTTKSIEEAKEELQNFGDLTDEYSAAYKAAGVDDKSWNYPKNHLQLHLPHDIRNKGVTKNFGTKIDESMHRSARAAYLRQTNFKNVAPQILKSVHRSTVCQYIRDQLDDLDGLFKDNDEDTPKDLEQLSNVVIGAKQHPMSFETMEQEFAHDLAFRNFRVRFSDFLSDFLQNYNIGLPDGRRIKYSRGQEIIPYQYLKVFYQSLDNWVNDVDYLRCSPSFHNLPRFDGALVKTISGDIFVQLVYLFTVTIDKKKHGFALVQPLDAPRGALSKRDKDLNFYRVKAKPRHASEFIPVRSIIRGALLVPDFSRPGDFLVVDLVDVDMWLRLKQMYSR
ncbi:hypothetical protein B0H19DRAFT_1099256 [Mycena capillaripes]|nr:hypothetical protein B0H19DRAFT_1099256 [Mycena capillaripes]